jgi:hypothetical protein
LEEPRLFQPPDERRDILLGRYSVHIKRPAQLFYYVFYTVLTIALIPYMSGGRVQLVNPLGVKIQYDELAFHIADFHVGSMLGTKLLDISLSISTSMSIHKEDLSGKEDWYVWDPTNSLAGLEGHSILGSN